jgi:hypothetical protein
MSVKNRCDGQGASLRDCLRSLFAQSPVYLALDDPASLSRGDLVRLALVTRPGEPDSLPYSESALVDFEKRFCEDRVFAAGRRSRLRYRFNSVWLSCRRR